MTDGPRLWGLTPAQLHDRFWLDQGVTVVRQGGATGHARHGRDTGLFLLLSPNAMVLFEVRHGLDRLRRSGQGQVVLSIVDSSGEPYRERVVSDAMGNFVRFDRLYSGSGCSRLRAVFTRDRTVAARWAKIASRSQAWNLVRPTTPGRRLVPAAVFGSVAHIGRREEPSRRLVERLVDQWQRPDRSIDGVRQILPGVFVHRTSRVAPCARFIGRTWLGEDAAVDATQTILGPAVLWDLSTGPGSGRMRLPLLHLEAKRDRPKLLAPRQIAPGRFAGVRGRESTVGRDQIRPTRQWRGKRLFDIVFSLIALAAVLPFFPVIMLLIWLDDGGPCFYVHARETLGGREFRCFKFRSMRLDADETKAQLRQDNVADGPQFYHPRDPRLTRLGDRLRRWNVDELPQFFNVLKGDMSIVGPRPSPHAENQFCPAWRETRLSVRAGLTGLWQIKRTRQKGLDFQEWIRYDLEYVERGGFRMDTVIVLRTLLRILRLA